MKTLGDLTDKSRAEQIENILPQSTWPMSRSATENRAIEILSNLRRFRVVSLLVSQLFRSLTGADSSSCMHWNFFFRIPGEIHPLSHARSSPRACLTDYCLVQFFKRKCSKVSHIQCCYYFYINCASLHPHTKKRKQGTARILRSQAQTRKSELHQKFPNLN